MQLPCKSVFCFLVGVLALAIISQSGQINCNSLNRKAFRNHKPKNSKASNQSCPENWAYLRQYHKCYELYSKGPCGERMEVSRMIQDGHSISLNGSPKCRCKLSNDGRPLVYWREQNRCYELFEQGPCPSGEWLVPTTRNARCEKIPCPDEFNRQLNLPDSIGFLFSYEGQCYNSGVSYRLELDPCPTSKLGAYFSQYYFWKHVCYAKRLHDVAPSIQNDPVYVCAEGFELDPNGGCERPTNL